MKELTMKLIKKLTVLTTMSLAIGVMSARAEMIIHSFGGADMCNQIEGQWSGQGKVTALGGIVQCEYSGTVQVTRIPASSLYNTHISLHTSDQLCPSTEELDLQASCENNIFKLHADKINLSGNVSSDGRTVNIGGTVEIPVMGTIVTAEVSDMHLDKQ